MKTFSTHYKKAIIALGIVITGVCALFFIHFYQEAENAAIATLNEEQMIQARQSARGIEDFFATWTRSLSSLAKMDEVVNTDPVGQRALKLFYEANQEQLLSITRLDENGVIIYNFPSSSSVGTDISAQPHVRDLLRDHKPVVSDVFKSVEGPEAVALHVPIFRESAFKGSIGILINFKVLALRHLDVVKTGKTGYVWVLSRDGTILYTPIAGFTGKSVFETIKGFPSLQVMVEDMLKGHEGAATYLFDRIGDRQVGPTRKYAVYLPVPIGNTFWSVAVGSDERDVLAGLSTLRNKLAWLFGALSLCGMTFTVLAAKTFLIIKEEEKRKLAETRLRESEERMLLATAAAKVGLWRRDLVRNEIWVSDTWRSIFGMAPSERVDFDTFFQKLHADDREKVRQDVAKALAGEGCYATEYRVVLPDGRIRWTTSLGRVEFDEHHQPVFLHGATVDITERKQAEDKFRLVVEASPNGTLLVNEQGQIVLVNPATEKLFGYVHDELIGQAVELLMPERFRIAHTGQRLGFLAAPQSRLLGTGRELLARRKDGSEFPVEVGLSPIQSAEGILILTVIVDVAARKQAEAEVQRQRTELAHVSRVSTMGVLTASLAHELNQPLGAILNNAQAASRFLVAAPPDLAEVRGALEDIAQDTRRAGEVIRQMRAFVKKDEPGMGPLDLNLVIHDVVRLLHSDTLMRKVWVALELAPELRRVNGDSVQLQQVLLNLLLNAFDAMAQVAEHRRTVVVRTRQLEAAVIRVEVRDSGTGISPDRMDKLFEPFRSSKRDGLGLGLSISHSIVTGHRGRLWAENNPEGGATFYFTLPVHAAEPNPDGAI